ncbi:MAG: CDP-alcohol phosphatidyltransferase family protein [Cyclobacteriaceae bacterium]
MKHIPNILTFARIAATPLFYYFLVTHQLTAGVTTFILVALTDIADGYLARKFDVESKLGQALDPFADKFMVAFALVAIVTTYDFPIWAILPFIARDIVSVLGSILYVLQKNPANWKPNKWGKYTTAGQVVTVVGYLIDHPAKEEALWITLFLSIFTAGSYLWRGIQFVSGRTSE